MLNEAEHLPKPFHEVIRAFGLRIAISMLAVLWLPNPNPNPVGPCHPPWPTCT